MIDTVAFQNEYGEILRPYEDYGVFLKSHNAALPEPKIYRVALDGADGDIDMTEWTGDTLFQSRPVRVDFRDMSASAYTHIANFLLGQRVQITFSEAPDYYYVGRCERPDNSTERRVTDFGFDFTCDPFRYARSKTHKTIVSAGVLVAARMPAVPVITADRACVLTYGETEYEIAQGKQTLARFVITRRPKQVTISNNAKVSFEWRDGVF